MRKLEAPFAERLRRPFQPNAYWSRQGKRRETDDAWPFEDGEQIALLADVACSDRRRSYLSPLKVVHRLSRHVHGKNARQAPAASQGSTGGFA